MAAFKEVWAYFSGSAGRWNEVFYKNAANIGVAGIIQPSLIDQRLALLHPTCTLQKIRVSQVDNPRVTVPVTVNRRGMDPGSVLGLIQAGISPANPSEAAVVSLSSTIGAGRRLWWMRGLSEYALSRDASGGTVVNAAFDTRLREFIQSLATQNYIILKRVPPVFGDTFDYRVVSVGASNATGRVELTLTANPVDLAKQDRITLQRFDPKQYPGLKGAFTVLDIVANKITIQYVTPTNAVTTPKTGTWRKLVWLTTAVITPVTSGLSYLGDRNTRNFTSGSRGARSAVRLRNLA